MRRELIGMLPQLPALSGPGRQRRVPQPDHEHL